MPQPFKGDSHLLWSCKTVSQRPELAKHIGIVVGMWSTVEAQLSHLIAALLHTDAFVGMTIYTELKSEPARFAAMTAIAAERLSPPEFEELQKLLTRVKKTSTQRDRLAHNIWATSDKYPESLFLCEAKDWAKFSASARSLESVGEERHDAIFDTLIKGAMEYKVHDFVFTQNAINDLYMDLFHFANALERRRQSLEDSPANH